MKTKIGQLLREISEETSVLSLHIHDLPKLLEIIELGEPAVPILLDHLREYLKEDEAGYVDSDFLDYAPWYAIIALTRITQANPIKPGHDGRLKNIVQDWFNWSENPEGAKQGGGNLTYWPDLEKSESEGGGPP